MLLLLCAAGMAGAATAPAQITLRLPIYDVCQAAPAEAAPAAVLLGGKEGSRVEVRLNRALLRRALIAESDLLGIAVRLRVRKQEGVLAGGAVRCAVAGATEAPVSVPVEEAVQDGWLHLTRMARAVRTALKGSAGDVVLDLSLDSPRSGALELATPAAADQADAPFALLAVKSRPKAALFTDAAHPWKGVFMQVRSGHLEYAGKRVRLWGVSLAPSANAGRAARLRSLGFNAARIVVEGLYNEESSKRGEMAPSHKGDGGRLDTYDRLIAELRGQGMFVVLVLPALRAMPGAMIDGSFLQGGDDWKEWQAAVTGEGNQGSLALYQYFDDRLLKIRKRHLANFLNHVNPYTGKRYADDECIAAIELEDGSDALRRIGQEGPNAGNDYFKKKIAAQWQEWLKHRYATDDALTKAWGSLQNGESLDKGTVKVEPVIWQRTSLPAARQQDLLRFCADHAASLYRELRAEVRRQAPRGAGANVVPVIFDTQPEPSPFCSYVYGQADAVSLSLGGTTPSTRLADPPGDPILDEGSVAGKPVFVSGVSVSRPNPYRCEQPLRLATIASWQDFDALFFRTWDGPDLGPRHSVSPEQYLLTPMPYPSPGLETQGTYSDADPALASAMAAAGELFRSFSVPAAPKPALYTVGRRAIFAFSTARGVGMRADTYRRGARMAFAPDRDVAVLVDGKPVAPTALPEVVRKGAKTPPPPNPAIAVDPGRPAAGAVDGGDCIRWDWPASRLVVDAPQAKVYIGPWRNPCRFRDGMVLSGISVPWVAFAAVSTDGRPLATGAGRVLVCAQANAVNTGYDMDLTRFSPDQELPSGDNAVPVFRDPGRAPVLVDKVAYTLSFPTGVTGKLSGCDFALRPTLSQPVQPAGVLRVKGTDDWLDVLTVAGRTGKASPVVTASVMPKERSPIWGLGVPARHLDLAGLWFPIPGLSWRDDYERMNRLVRQSPLCFTDINNPDKEPKPTHLLKMASDSFLGLPANIEMTFTGEMPSQVMVMFRKSPEFDALVSAYRKELGAPQSVVPPAKPGELQTASWLVRRPAGDVAVSIEAKSYQVKVTYELKPAAGGGKP